MKIIKMTKDVGKCQTVKCNYEGNLYNVNKVMICYKCFMELDLMNASTRKWM